MCVCVRACVPACVYIKVTVDYMNVYARATSSRIGNRGRGDRI